LERARIKAEELSNWPIDRFSGIEEKGVGE
jgi:hypothetical protein